MERDRSGRIGSFACAVKMAEPKHGSIRPCCAGRVWVRAANADEAVSTAAERLGQMGGWNVGPDVEQEVFHANEYREHAQPGDYTRSVIFQDRPG